MKEQEIKSRIKAQFEPKKNTGCYGVVTNDGHVDVSRTEKGANQYATRNGYNEISLRIGYSAAIVARKEGDKWINLIE